ncbi:glutathione hydrolase 6 isoform X4 [Hippopotamus amphibius kiboko]|uniref:glutathione hydrolase 6 isoform X4 n=1 Tax=Hippopotamus amphibius kiboko TaxID=575201 RepID=UPI0025996222|nr:glutathione hydrolase 6 isoform X4 [Hippopotamus amphibius kiboko]
MERAAGPVLYQKLLVSEPSLESEDEEEKLSEWLIPDLSGTQDSSGSKAGSLPRACAQLVAALLLLAVGFSLAVRQLHSSGGSPGTLGSGAPATSGHAHGPGVYHHGGIISPSATCSYLGRELLVAGGNVVDAGVGAALCLAVVHPHATGLGQCPQRWQRPCHGGQQRLCAPSRVFTQQLLRLWTPIPKHRGSTQQPGGQVCN